MQVSDVGGNSAPLPIHTFYQLELQVRNILGEEGEKAELLCSGPTLAMELVMEDAVSKFAQLANEKVAFPMDSNSPLGFWAFMPSYISKGHSCLQT